MDILRGNEQKYVWGWVFAGLLTRSYVLKYINFGLWVSGTKNNEVALLLKLTLPASDLVTFVPHNRSQYIKFSFNDNYILCVLNLYDFSNLCSHF